MPGLPALRVGDFCSGHQGGDPRPVISGSVDTFINNIPAARAGDVWNLHGVPPHTGIGVTGSETVFCNGRPLMRMGDPISCGSHGGAGSFDVFCG